MPEISRSYGIVVGMFYDEHRPPHFHVRYGEHQAVVRINDLVLTEGRLPPRAWGLVSNGRRNTVPSCWIIGKLLKTAARCVRLNR